MKQTVRAWFETLPDPIREKAFKNTEESDLLKTSESLSAAIDLAFNWWNSPEKFDYWEDVYITNLTNEENEPKDTKD